ncbi:MAG: hypothetical protein PUD20_06780 [bacterium]|nr:hypothetical protein [bacterium]
MKKLKQYCLGLLCVLVSAMVAILVHVFLPSPGAQTNPELFDGYLVSLLGFPFVASMYFVILYVHIMVVFFIFGEKSMIENIKFGLVYGIAFGLLYLFGMQEVVVEGSPLDVYGLDFVSYQFFIGLGDAIPVLFLCLILARCIAKKNSYEKQMDQKRIIEKAVKILVVGSCFFAQRTVRYDIGYIDSDIQKYPIPVLIWTAVMGLVFGVISLMIESVHPLVSDRRKHLEVHVMIIGLNWIWFNCFIGLIMKDTFLKMLLRGTIDVFFITVASILATVVSSRLNKKQRNHDAAVG